MTTTELSGKVGVRALYLILGARIRIQVRRKADLLWLLGIDTNAWFP